MGRQRPNASEPDHGATSEEIARERAGSVRIVLPWSVLAQVNHRLVSRGRGPGLTLAADYRAKKHAAEVLALGQVAPPRPRFRGPVRMELDFYEPDRRRRDPSNLVKMLEDTLTGILYDDDSRIVAMTWRRAGLDRARPRVELTLTPLSHSAAA